MATDAYTVNGTDAITQQGSMDLSQAAYDRLAYFSYRPELYFDAAADIQPTAQSMPGSSVTFTIVNDIPIAASPLSETQDVAAVAISDSQVTLTLTEYGNALITTAKLRGTAFVDVDPVAANVIGYNAGVSIDTVARAALDSGTNVMYASGLGATSIQSAVTTRAGLVQGTNTISSVDLRAIRARLRNSNVPTFNGLYVGYIDPDLVADLQGESISSSSVQGWRAPHVYSAPDQIWNGELGSYEGIRWIETPRAPVFEGGGSASGLTAGVYTITVPIVAGSGTVGAGTFTGQAPSIGATLATSGATVVATVTITSITDSTFTCTANSTGSVTTGTVTVSSVGANVYATLVLGRQSLAKAYSMIDGNGANPHVVPGPVTDRLRRLVPLGWYWLGAYKIFRQASIIRLESTSTLGADIMNATYEPAVDLGESGNPQA